MSKHFPAGHRAGPWIFRDLLGEGGTAAVYRVEHETLGIVRALKISSPENALEERLRLEGRFLARLSHPNVVSVHDILEIEDKVGLLMDYVRGPSLQQLLALGPIDTETADAIARGVLAGVAAAHDLGIVHRDLKPGNILLSIEDGLVPKVADFGLARDLRSKARMTLLGSLFGTPEYMSPEQVKDASAIDIRSDVFSLGSILYEILSGHVAFDGADLPEILERVSSLSYRRLSPKPGQERMVAAIEAAMQPDPAARPQSARALLSLWTGEPPERTTLVPVREPAILERARSLLRSPVPLPRAIQTTRASGPVESPARRSSAMLLAGTAIFLPSIACALPAAMSAVALLVVLLVPRPEEVASETLPVIQPPAEVLEETIAEAPIAELPPPPVPEGMARIEVDGENLTEVRLSDGRVNFSPGNVPAGSYGVDVKFKGEEDFNVGPRLDVRPGDRLAFFCTAADGCESVPPSSDASGDRRQSPPSGAPTARAAQASPTEGSSRP